MATDQLTLPHAALVLSGPEVDAFVQNLADLEITPFKASASVEYELDDADYYDLKIQAAEDAFDAGAMDVVKISRSLRESRTVVFHKDGAFSANISLHAGLELACNQIDEVKETLGIDTIHTTCQGVVVHLMNSKLSPN